MKSSSNGRQSGQELIEFALVMPILLLLLLGIMEFSMVIFSYSTVANAAREGARYGIIHPDDTSGIEGAARVHTTGLDPVRLQIVVSRPDANTVRVAVDYDYSLITAPIIQAVGGDPDLPLQTVATMYVE